jgi:protoporphyrinogen oxidase
MGEGTSCAAPPPPPPPGAAWAPPSRAAQLARLRSEEFDVVVVGGGCVGAGVAWEAATRGLRVALVEREDFGSGTSGRSTKLIHGGIRYLEAAFKNLDLGLYRLVHEALEEVRLGGRAAAAAAAAARLPAARHLLPSPLSLSRISLPLPPLCRSARTC